MLDAILAKPGAQPVELIQVVDGADAHSMKKGAAGI
jgi:hypothetical protein